MNELKIRFKPISHSWVALHPQPKGIIQFIGGAFFGTFGTTFFYENLLKYLFLEGYTLIVMPFKFTFNHYKESGFLIQEQYEILPELVRIAKLNHYDYTIYLDEKNFSWLGHSVGCKYISLLEGFSSLPKNKVDRDRFIREVLGKDFNEKRLLNTIRDIDNLIEELQKSIINIQKMIDYYIDEDVLITNIFIKNQTSILLAPDISDTSSAIRPKVLANLIDALGLGVQPTPKETFRLIQLSNLFNLLGLVKFKSDKIAQKTCDWFINILRKPPEDLLKILEGGHLRPLGTDLGNYVINFLDKPILTSIRKRNQEFESELGYLRSKLNDKI